MNTPSTQASGTVPAVVTSDWLADARTAIETARTFADQHEVRIGWFVLRDLEATKRAGLSDLAWSGHEHGVTLGELRWFIGELERFLSSANTPSQTTQPQSPEHQ